MIGSGARLDERDVARGRVAGRQRGLRPRWGVTFSALMFDLVFTMEAFLLTKNLLTLLIALPIHGVCALLCARDARFFDLILLWGRTRMPAYFANFRLWKASSYSPLDLGRQWAP